MKKSRAHIALLLFLILFSEARAAVYINEIMFNPEGTDSGHEWIEVCSSENGEDLNSLVLEDSSGSKKVKHNLELKQSDGILQKDECAIIASKEDVFKTDYPNVSSSLFDASPNFSLLNSGEELSIYNNDMIVDMVSYTPSGVAEGQSLHRNGNSFIPAEPTPGNKNFTASSEMEDSDSEDSENNNAAVKNITELPIYKFKVVEVEPPQDIFIRTHKSIKLFTYENLELPIEIFDARGKSVDKALVIINWGDLSEATNKEPYTHHYKKSGKFIISVKARLGTLQDYKFILVDVSPPKLKLFMSEDGKSLSIYNYADTQINIEGWKLTDGYKIKELPLVYIAPDSKLKILIDDFFGLIRQGAMYTLLSPDKDISIDAATVMEEAISKDSDKQRNVKSATGSSGGGKDIQPIESSLARENSSSNHIESTMRNSGLAVGSSANNSVSNKSSSSKLVRNFNGNRIALGLEVSNLGKSRSSYADQKIQYVNKHKNDVVFDSDIYEASAHRANKLSLSWLYAGFFVFVLAFFFFVLYSIKKDRFEDWEFEDFAD